MSQAIFQQYLESRYNGRGTVLKMMSGYPPARIAQTHSQRFIYYSSSLGAICGASKSGTETARSAEKWTRSDAAEVVAVS